MRLLNLTHWCLSLPNKSEASRQQSPVNFHNVNDTARTIQNDYEWIINIIDLILHLFALLRSFGVCLPLSAWDKATERLWTELEIPTNKLQGGATGMKAQSTVLSSWSMETTWNHYGIWSLTKMLVVTVSLSATMDWYPFYKQNGAYHQQTC